MIKAEDGRVEMNGDIIDLSMECLCVIETFCEMTEEMVPGSEDVFLGCLIRFAEDRRSKDVELQGNHFNDGYPDDYDFGQHLHDSSFIDDGMVYEEEEED